MDNQEINHQSDSAAERPLEDNDTEPTPATILIVDDNIAEAVACRDILRHAGYNVLLTTEGGQGLQVLQSDPHGIDLIILDWILPGMSGDQWLEWFLEIAPDVKVLFISGKFLPDALREELRTKICGFLKKPFTGPDLLYTVEQGLQGDNT